MYSVILIDDEIYTINNIKQSIDWEHFGFRVDRVFSKSTEALEYIKSNDVDVVITDIRMPIISGLEIAKYCYINKPATNVILLSAYTDFEHAREGIKYRVLDYITKPVSISDINAVLIKLFSHLENNRYARSFMNNELKNDIRTHIMNFVSAQAPNSDEEKILSNLFQKFGISIDLSKSQFAVLSFAIKDADYFYQNIWKYGRDRLISSLGQIINSPQNGAYISLSHFYEIGFDVFIISDKLPENDFVEFVTSQTEKLESVLKDCLNITSSVSNMKISNNIDDIRDYTDENSISPQSSDLSGKEFALISAKKYIDTHYNEKLSLVDISKIASFHPRYFSQLFNEYFNISFSDYLSNVRLEHAKELLAETDTKITNIPYMIGLQHLTNFSKRFEKYTGLSPSEYRTKYRKK